MLLKLNDDATLKLLQQLNDGTTLLLLLLLKLKLNDGAMLKLLLQQKLNDGEQQQPKKKSADVLPKRRCAFFV